jgi:hypothetical protein
MNLYSKNAFELTYKIVKTKKMYLPNNKYF